MKNVYTIIIAILFGTCLQAQYLQNKNWLYGNYQGLVFSPLGVPQYVGGAMSTRQSCATISDFNSGQLLFYTNGVQVWDINHNQMPNGFGLKGNINNSQGVIIVPHHDYPHRYFVITIDGINGQKKGLYYSEVDMTLNNGLGDIIPSVKNIPFKDENGANIDEQWIYNGDRNLFDKLTMVKSGNSGSYWIVTHLKNKIYAYRATGSGISNTPVISDSPFSDGESGQIKIYYYDWKIAEVNNTSIVALGQFNPYTGKVTYNNIIDVAETFPEADGLTSIEFSGYGNVLYVGKQGTTYYFYSSGIGPIYSYSWPDTTTGLAHQIALNNKIYVGLGTNLGVINNPDNISNPGFGNINIPGSSAYGFPQRVDQITPYCYYLSLTTEPNTTFVYDHNTDIVTSQNYIITSGKDITMRARDYIWLKPNTYIAPGANYLAEINYCYNPVIGGDENTIQTTFDEETTHLSSEKAELFTLAPNPASSIVTLTSSKEIQSVTITSLEGRTMYSHTFKGQKSVDIDVYTFIEGYYSVTVITADGEMETQKLIKN